jgi:tetratricopeptide (TPR) repeat protein
MGHTDTAKFCPSCGARRQRQWRFCAECGAAVDGAAAGSAARRRSPAVGLAVFGVLVLAGVAMWLRILEPRERSGPPGSPTNRADAGDAGAAGSLPEGHPPVEPLSVPEDVKQFIATLAEETARQPKDAAAWTKLAEVQYRAARIDPTYYAAALGSYRHLHEIDPGNADAVRGLANVHYDRQEYASARPYFEEYLKVRPDDRAAQTDLATVRMNLGEVDEAIAGYREIIAADPTFLQAHYNLGVALHRTGDDAGAIDAFRRAKEVTTDERVRARVDLILGQLGAGAAEAAGTTPVEAAPSAGQPERTPFQQAVETFFRGHQIIGSKVVTIEWPGPTTAAVNVRDFPMSAMPPFAREKFTSRMRDALRQAKESTGTSGAAEVAITDAATKAVMETMRE